MIHEKIIIQEQSIQDEEAYMMTYFWEESKELYPGQKRPVILICPGGAYRMTSDREAEGAALRFMAMGYHTAVLRYTAAPSRYPSQLLQLAKAVSILKENSERWLIEKDAVIVMGFSAGGHLAASLGVFWNRPWLGAALGVPAEMIRPQGMILSYPVISSGEYGHRESFRNLLGERYEELREEVSLEKQVTADTPKAFVWHTAEDSTVPAENSLYFVAAMRRCGVSVEFHLFPHGGHGAGLGTELTASADGKGIISGAGSWSGLAGRWLQEEFPWWKPEKTGKVFVKNWKKTV